MSPVLANYLGLLWLGGILGVVGQGVRTIVQKIGDQVGSHQSNSSPGARFLTSLLIGFIAGAAAAIVTVNIGDLSKLSAVTLLGLATAGYAGTDFIGGVASRFTGGASVAGAESKSRSSSILSNRSRGTGSVAAVERSFVTPRVPIQPFTQAVADACAAISLRNSTDIASVFDGQGGFFAWYNSVLSVTPAFQHRGRAPNSTAINQHFAQFWDQIPITFGRSQISMIEFCALMSINIQETTGDLTAAPEEMNGQNRPHPGLAYAFDKISGLKQSYNVAPNQTAYQLFNDFYFLKQHAGLTGSATVLNNPGGIDPAWSGQAWPTSYPSTVVDPSVNGFVMTADFYKFRGRGVIQTTWRSDYKLLISYILSSAASGNLTLATLAQKWTAAVPGLSGDAQIDAIATISTDADWTSAFGEPLTLAAGVSIDNNAKGGYLSLSRDAAVLQADKRTKGSLLYMAAKINGGSYPTTVAPMMETMMCTVAGLSQSSAVAMARLPRWPDA
jgi:hypothetical protein